MRWGKVTAFAQVKAFLAKGQTFLPRNVSVFINPLLAQDAWKIEYLDLVKSATWGRHTFQSWFFCIQKLHKSQSKGDKKRFAADLAGKKDVSLWWERNTKMIAKPFKCFATVQWSKVSSKKQKKNVETGGFDRFITVAMPTRRLWGCAIPFYCSPRYSWWGKHRH